MNQPKKTPRDLLVDLSVENHELRAKIFTDPVAALEPYDITVDAGWLVDPRRPPPPHTHVKAALDKLDGKAQTTQSQWETYALLVVVIGAIPFVAADAR